MFLTLESINELEISFRQYRVFRLFLQLGPLQGLQCSIKSAFLPLGAVIWLLPAPKNDSVGRSSAAAMCPRPLSVAKAYSQRDKIFIESRNEYFPHKEVIEVPLQKSIIWLALLVSAFDPKIMYCL